MNIKVDPANAGDIERLSTIFVNAFVVDEDPLETLLYPDGVDPVKRKASITSWLASSCTDPKYSLVKATVDDQIAGFALWAKPTNDPIPTEFYPNGPSEEQKAAMDTGVMADFKRACFVSRRKYLADTPFWALELLGVDPAFQRKGIGSALLAWSSAQADQTGHPSWVEASPKGAGLYKNRGYKVLGTDTVTSQRLGKTIEWPHLMREPSSD